MRFVVAVLTVCVLLSPRSAGASPILEPSGRVVGSFGWVHDVLFQTGSTFSVTNESNADFVDVFVDLYAPSETVPFISLSLGAVVAGGSGQSIDDLSALLVPEDISVALLRLSFANAPLSASIFATSLSGDPLDLLAGATDILAPAQSPAPIPEPTTLVLMGVGILTGGLRRILSRHTGETPL
jgi:hypothetical protein